MSAPVSPIPPGPGGVPVGGQDALASQIQLSCHVPLLILFLGSAAWLLVGSAFALISSIKFHAPSFLADCSCLTYGRVRPAYLNTLVYGFCLQAGLGIVLWLIARLGRALLAFPFAVLIGTVFLNLGVTAGLLGILLGDSTGFEYLDMPRYSALLIFLGYLPIGLSGVVTFHHRQESALFPSLWFLFAALFWFPWVYSTANLLLLVSPVRGMSQAVIAWWFADNLLTVWLGLVGIGAIFYFVPKLAKRELQSHYLALFTFWLLILIGSWGGIPNAAPVPAWMPTVSAIAAVLAIVPILAFGLNVVQTAGRVSPFVPANPTLSFILFGALAFVVAGFLKAGGVLLDSQQLLSLSWFTTARAQLQIYGFFAMVIFGACYYVLPQIAGIDFPWPKFIRAHFLLAAAGVILLVVPLAMAGVSQSFGLANPKVPFLDSLKSTLMPLRLSTMGDLLLLLGHVLFLANLVGLATRVCRVPITSAYAVATADLFNPAEAKS